ncbi:hypothetical protein ACKFKG_28040 [Phormidesmis sp. 146-35]
MFTLEQIDQRLSDWQHKVGLVSQILIELQDIYTYQRLSGDSGVPTIQLTGATAAQVMPAWEAMNDLLQHFDLLVKTSDRITQLRKQYSRFLGSQQILQEIEETLTDVWIQLSVERLPPSQRNFLTQEGAISTISPAQLLTVMLAVFQTAKEVMLAVDVAWSAIDLKLSTAETELRSLRQSANLLEQTIIVGLTQAEQAIATIQAQIAQDPLGVHDQFEQTIQPLITQARNALEQSAQQRTQVQEKLAIAHQLLSELEKIHQGAIAAFAESREKVVDHSMLIDPIASEQIAALHQWLTRLETKFAQGFISPILVGLENLTQNINQAIATEKRAYSANLAPIATRQELRGRLDALKAKALAKGLSEDATLINLATQAKQLLYTRPTPLEKASELISHYEKRLNGKKVLD